MTLDFSKLKRKGLNYSGLMSFYRSKEPMKSIICEVNLSDKVDPKILQQAVDKTLERMPYFGDTFVEENGRFYYAENPLPMVVRETDVYPHIGGSETNFHMVDVICHDNVISISMFHSFCDGMGIAKFIEAVLYYYFSIKDGVDYEPNGVVTHHTAMTAAETFEPYETPYSFDATALPEVPPIGKPFQLPEFTGKMKDTFKTIPITVSEKELVSYAKSIGSSPSVVLAMMLVEAIESIHPDHKDPIVGIIPSSSRLALGCPETFKNCIGPLVLSFNSPELDKLSFEERAAQIRNLQKLQMNPDLVRASSNKVIDSCHKIAEMPGGYWDKLETVAGFRALNGSMATFIMNYVNALHHHPYDENILGIKVVSDPVGLTVLSYALGGLIHFDLLFMDDMTCYGYAMGEVLRKHGFKAEVSAPTECSAPPSGWREIMSEG